MLLLIQRANISVGRLEDGTVHVSILYFYLLILIFYIYYNVVSCSADLSIKVWDINNDYKCIKTLFGHDHSVSSVRFLPSGDKIVSASRDKTIKEWDVAAGYGEKSLAGHAEWVRSVEPSEDGRWLVTASNDQVKK